MRSTILTLVALLVAFPAVALGQKGGDAELIRNALSAAPVSVADHATVANLDGTVLRAGTSDFVCMPDMPDVPNNSPMCLDANWREVIDAWMNHREPKFEGIGISYMLQGDLPVSNVDPFATGPTADNEWIQEGRPHLMVVLSDQTPLEALSTDPHNGGPWVMWKGTQYAHIMIPTIPRSE